MRRLHSSCTHLPHHVLLERQLVDAGLTALAELRAVVERIVVREGSITLRRLRDEHVTSRRPALAVLRQLDDLHVTPPTPG